MSLLTSLALFALAAGASTGDRSHELLAVFILEGDGAAVAVADPAGALRKTIESEVPSSLAAPARMMTLEEKRRVISEHPAEFAKAATAREGATAMGAPLLFSLSMRTVQSGARVVLSFGHTTAERPLVEIELKGTSTAQLLEDWARKRDPFRGAVRRAVADMTAGKGIAPAARGG